MTIRMARAICGCLAVEERFGYPECVFPDCSCAALRRRQAKAAYDAEYA